MEIASGDVVFLLFGVQNQKFSNDALHLHTRCFQDTPLPMNDKPRAFISYAHQDGEEFATDLRKRLEREEPEITLWQDRSKLEGGIGWWRQITEALDSVKFLILVLTPAAAYSPIARQEWRYARQSGVCIYPVKGFRDSQFDYNSVPKWMSKVHFFDLAKEWDTFVNYLKSPCHTVRVPFMVPDLPEGYVERLGLTEHLLGSFIDRADQTALAPNLSLCGTGGLGKTTLATAICHNDDIINSFDDGILWVTLGQTPNVRDSLGKLYAALTGQRPGFFDEDDAAFHLSQKLEDKNCLIVIDDVWDPVHLEPFMRGSRGCSRLITTRNFDIAADTIVVEIEHMSESEAVVMLSGRLTESSIKLGSFKKLAKKLGNWPLLLELANSALRQRMRRGDSIHNALEYLNRKLIAQGITAFDQRNPSARNYALTRTIEISLDQLEQEELEKYISLAIFPGNISVPIEQSANLWGCSELEAEDLIQHFDSFSLVKLEIETGQFQIHDVMRGTIRKRLSDPGSLHKQLIASWGDPYQLSSDYAWRWNAYHSIESNNEKRLRKLLLDFEWIQAKLSATNIASLIQDFSYLPQDRDLQMVLGVIRLAAHVLVHDETQLAGQILGRLSHDSSTECNLLSKGASKWSGTTWIRPLVPSLIESGGALLATLRGHKGKIRSVALSSDGMYAISVSDDRTVRVWELEKGIEKHVLKGHLDWIRAIDILPDNSRVISTGDDHTIRIWDIETGKIVNIVEVPGLWPVNLSVTPDGSHALVGGKGGAMRFVDLHCMRARLFKGHSQTINSIAMLPDGKHAISASDDRTLRVWSLDGSSDSFILGNLKAKVIAVVVSSDGRFALTASSDDILRTWPLTEDYTSGQPEGLVITKEAYWVRTIALAPDGHTAITGADDGSLRTWNLETGNLNSIFEGHVGRINAVDVSPDGLRTITASDDRMLKIWDLTSDSSNRERKGHKKKVRALVSTADGRFTYSTADDHKLKVWDTVKCQEVFSFPGYRHWPLAITPNGKYAVSVSPRRYASLEVIECLTYKVHMVLKGHTDVLCAVAISPDSRWVVSASDDGTIRCWDIRFGDSKILIQTGKHYIRALAILPDNHHVISGSYDCTLKMWDLNKGNEIGIFVGHIAPVNDVAVSQDGSVIISASIDSTIRVWSPNSFKQKMVWDAHEGAVNSVAIDNKGKYAVSVSDDCTVRLWSLLEGKLVSVYTGDSPMKVCTIDNQGKIVAGDQSGVLHFLQVENA